MNKQGGKRIISGGGLEPFLGRGLTVCFPSPEFPHPFVLLKTSQDRKEQQTAPTLELSFLTCLHLGLHFNGDEHKVTDPNLLFPKVFHPLCFSLISDFYEISRPECCCAVALFELFLKEPKPELGLGLDCVCKHRQQPNYL